MPNRIIVAATTDASGDFTTETIPVEGRVLQYRYIPDASSPLATGADLTITGKDTGLVIAQVPRQGVHDTGGAASLYAAAGEPVEDYIWVNEALTVTIAQGGNTLAGTVHIWVG